MYTNRERYELIKSLMNEFHDRAAQTLKPHEMVFWHNLEKYCHDTLIEIEAVAIDKYLNGELE